jgi:hypothetical protein
MIETQKGAAQLSIRRECRQPATQSPQQTLMDQFLVGDARQPTASSVLERRTSKMGKSVRRRFLAAGEDLEELGKRLGRGIAEPEWPDWKRGGKRISKPEAYLTLDQSDHGGLASVGVKMAAGVSSWVPQFGDQRPVMVAAHNVSGLVQGPDGLRKKAVVKVELIVDDRPFVGLDVRIRFNEIA